MSDGSSSGGGAATKPMFLLQAGTSQHRMYQAFGWLCLAIPMILAPYMMPSFRVAQLAQCAGWGVFLLGMNVCIGWTGLLSLGHIAFCGVGAYTTTILINESGWDFWMTLPMAFIVCFIAGGLVGLPALKIKGLYLALVTFALAYTFPILLKIEGGGIARRTGGDNGRNLEDKLVPTETIRKLLFINGEGTDESTRIAVYKYVVAVLVLLVCFLIVRNILGSRAGRSMIAVRDNQIGAAVSGVPLNKTKVLAFALSAAIAGIGGSLIAMVLDSVGPSVFDANYAIITLMGLVLAGVGTLHGAWLGGVFVVFLQDLAPRAVGLIPVFDVDVVYARAIYGLMLVLVAFFMPGGVVSFGRKWRARVIQVQPKVPDTSHLPRAGAPPVTATAAA